MWRHGLNPLSVLSGGMTACAAACETLLSDSELIQRLVGFNFKIVIMDFLYNECGLALAEFLRELF